MELQNLKEKFERMGARLKIGSIGRRSVARDISINILKDHKGEYFELTTDPARKFRIDALDVRPKDRHLLLMVAAERDSAPSAGEKQKFLCGHDERSWFVAAVPGASVSNVMTAMEALKPAGVRDSQARNKVKAAHRNRRKNRGFIRQGEWFFVPRLDLKVDQRAVLFSEPLARGNGGKPHWAEFAYRTGGETVYVNERYPNGLSVGQFTQLFGRNSAAKAGFRVMQRNATVFVKGRISHPDHKTIQLNGWHSVAMNTENHAPAMRHVAFLD